MYVFVVMCMCLCVCVGTFTCNRLSIIVFYLLILNIKVHAGMYRRMYVFLRNDFMYVCTYACIHTMILCTYVHMHMHATVQTIHILVFMCGNISEKVRIACVRSYIDNHTYAVCLCVCMCVCMYVHPCIYPVTHTYIHTSGQMYVCPSMHLSSVCMCVHPCIYPDHSSL